MVGLWRRIWRDCEFPPTFALGSSVLPSVVPLSFLDSSVAIARTSRLWLLLSLLIVCSGGMANQLDEWRKYAYMCEAAPDKVPFPSKPETDGRNPGPCDDGDMTLFNGLLCYSGESIACDAVRRSQTSDGRFWRSPLRAQTNNLHYEEGQRFSANQGHDKSFSDDMEAGVLLWAIKTKNDPNTRAALINWFKWMSNNRPCIQPRLLDWCPTWDDWRRSCPGEGCVLRNLPRYCDDAACTMQPVHRDIDNAVYSFVVGDEPPDGIGNYNNKANELLALSWVFTLGRLALPASVTSAYLNLSVGEKIYDSTRLESQDAVERFFGKRRSGYPLHKTAIRAWMLVQINRPDQQRAKDALDYIAKVEPDNALFQFFNEGPTERVKQLVVSYCPRGIDVEKSTRLEWMWEQAYSTTWPKPYNKEGRSTSMLWDCILMANLLGINRGEVLRDSRVDAAVGVINSMLLHRDVGDQ
jgi:hypothetical protein